MRVLVQYALSSPGDWEEIDSLDWASTPSRPDPTGQPPGADNQRGWISAINRDGVTIESHDHYAVLTPAADTVVLIGWSPSYQTAIEATFRTLAPDPTKNGAINTRQSFVWYRDEPLPRIGENTQQLPWSAFRPPPGNVTRHGRQLSDELQETHKKARSVVGWREFTDGLPGHELENGRVPDQRAKGRFVKAKGTRTYYGSTTSLATTAHNAQQELAYLTTTGSAGSLSASCKKGAETIAFVFSSPENEPNSADWPNGTYRAQLDVTAAGTLTYGLINGAFPGHFSRVNAALSSDLETVYQSQATFSGTGLKLATQSWDPTSGSATDRFEICVIAVNPDTKNAQDLTLQLNETDDYADGPWPAAALQASATEPAGASAGTNNATVTPGAVSATETAPAGATATTNDASVSAGTPQQATATDPAGATAGTHDATVTVGGVNVSATDPAGATAGTNDAAVTPGAVSATATDPAGATATTSDASVTAGAVLVNATDPAGATATTDDATVTVGAVQVSQTDPAGATATSNDADAMLLLEAAVTAPATAEAGSGSRITPWMAGEPATMCGATSLLAAAQLTINSVVRNPVAIFIGGDAAAGSILERYYGTETLTTAGGSPSYGVLGPYWGNDNLGLKGDGTASFASAGNTFCDLTTEDLLVIGASRIATTSAKDIISKGAKGSPSIGWGVSSNDGLALWMNDASYDRELSASGLTAGSFHFWAVMWNRDESTYAGAFIVDGVEVGSWNADPSVIGSLTVASPFLLFGATPFDEDLFYLAIYRASGMFAAGSGGVAEVVSLVQDLFSRYNGTYLETDAGGTYVPTSVSRASGAYTQKVESGATKLYSVPDGYPRIVEIATGHEGLAIEERTVNYVGNPDDLSDTTWWDIVGVSVTPASAAAPDGELTAAKVTEDDQTSEHRAWSKRWPTLATGTHHMCVLMWCKNINAGRVALNIMNEDSGATNARCAFNLGTGNEETPSSTTGGVVTSVTNLAAELESDGAGGYFAWLACSITVSDTYYPTLIHGVPPVAGDDLRTSRAGQNQDQYYAWEPQHTIGRLYPSSVVKRHGE